jgi:hypothetical protein
LKISAGAGTPKPTTSIHIDRILIFSTNACPASWTLQIPSTGNLGVAYSLLGGVITSATDSDSVAWTLVSPANVAPEFIYRPNQAPSTSRTITVAMTGTYQGNVMQLAYFDISNAATSPYDTSVGAVNQSTTSAQTTISHQPDITPAGGVSELIIAFLENGNGPCSSVTSPAGATWDFPIYTGQGDAGQMAFGDGLAHLYTSSGAAEAWNWTFVAPGVASNVQGSAVAFKGVPAGNVPYDPWPLWAPLLGQ